MTAAAQTPTLDRVPLAIGMMLAFCAIAPLIDVAAKYAAQSVSVTQVTFFRMVVQAAVMLPVVLVLGQSLRIGARAALWLSARALMLIGSTYAFVGAVKAMPLADALAIVFVEPFILLALGALLFGDQVGPRRIGAAVVGFLGALLVIQPNFAAFGAVAFYPLATAVFFAFYMLLTRRVSRFVAPVAMQFHTAWIGVVWMLPALALGYALDWELMALTNPAPLVWGQLVCVGLAASVSHMAITVALRFAPSATLAPLHYLEIVTSVLFGWYFFGDLPNPLSWAGIAVIVASGLYIIARERALARVARLPIHL
ncbi:DMT family transporter [Pararhodobacter zhoushanensis]|uniref:DMT family transporter n=1 Tax=Pararhodobacter zhoushanensis TaxID=2479545 RepID=A0ABT3H3S7_9RHOB|nr:DMT family transporter [Pararhodobacter zhoushanensis]MCW1934405.1 DMT family transporter [Pararhodobacter zhoushanensis]